METTSATVENLNDLVQILNDRIVGYEKALKDLKEDDTSLRSLFTSLVDQSHKFKMELGTEVQALGGDIETDTTFSGKIFRTWMSVKDAFGSTNKSVLENCEFGEDAALKAYKTVLEEESLPSYVREIVTRQEGELRSCHDQVKAARDSVAE